MIFTCSGTKTEVFSFKLNMTSYNEFAIQKMVMTNGMIYTLSHSELYKMPVDFEYEKHYSTYKVKHEVIFKSRESMIDFAFAPNMFQLAVLSKSSNLSVIDQFSGDVIYQISNFQGLKIMMPTNFDVDNLPVVMGIS